MASYLHAKANQGLWLLRIDDLDSPRNQPGATDSIIKALELYGLHWDREIYYQSDKVADYEAIVSSLWQQNQLYPCTCTRKKLAEINAKIYPQTCLKNPPDSHQPHALRIKSKAIEISFFDELQGLVSENIAHQQGDFIVKRKDNIIAYQLAVVIDDALQNITHVIRGYDLLDSTPKQIFLQQLLTYKTPHYCHVPIITDANGNKLSKQTFAQPLPMEKPQKILFTLLKWLQQNPPSILNKATVSELITWAITHWDPKPLKKTRAINNNFD